MPLGRGRVIGTCGTTGNSEAEHVHLEIRAHQNPHETSWARMAGGRRPRRARRYQVRRAGGR